MITKHNKTKSLPADANPPIPCARHPVSSTGRPRQRNRVWVKPGCDGFLEIALPAHKGSRTVGNGSLTYKVASKGLDLDGITNYGRLAGFMNARTPCESPAFNLKAVPKAVLVVVT